jgi:hypothetical protein
LPKGDEKWGGGGQITIPVWFRQKNAIRELPTAKTTNRGQLTRSSLLEPIPPSQLRSSKKNHLFSFAIRRLQLSGNQNKKKGSRKTNERRRMWGGGKKNMDARLAIISDIHGNAQALEETLSSIKTKGIRKIICLGDVAATGPEPCRAIRLLRDLGEDCLTIKGNWDEWILGPPPRPPSFAKETHRRFFEMGVWGANQLGETERSFLGKLPAMLSLPLDGDTKLFCFHATPRSLS